MENTLALREVTDRGIGYGLPDDILAACLRLDNGHKVIAKCYLESIQEKRDAIVENIADCDAAIKDAVNFSANDRSLALVRRVKELDSLFKLVFDALAAEKERVAEALRPKRPGWLFSVQASRKPTRREGSAYENLEDPIHPETELTITAHKLQDNVSASDDVMARARALRNKPNGATTITRDPKTGSEKINAPVNPVAK